MARWLFKEEPTCYSYDQLEIDGQTTWEGVKNPAALKNLRAIHVGDRVWLYHTGKEKSVIGEMKVTAAADGAVTVAPVRRLARPVALAELKAEPSLADWELVRIPRLSVLPVSAAQWALVEKLARRPVPE